MNEEYKDSKNEMIITHDIDLLVYFNNLQNI